MSQIIRRSAKSLREEIAENRDEAEVLREEAASLERRASELEAELKKLESGNNQPSEYQQAIEQLLSAPDLAEWERLRIEEQLAAGKLTPSTLLSRFMALGRGVPAVVFDEMEAVR